MAKTLGLDLGSNSIGWALVENHEGKPTKILGMGSRIVPIEGKVLDAFNKGQAITINAKRTEKRTARKLIDRYQMRRFNLCEILKQNNMMPSHELMCAPKELLWKLRSDAVSKQISLQELGRVLYHINQKRGFKLAKSDASSTDKKATEYVTGINNRCAAIFGRTIGEYVHSELERNPEFRYKELVYTREKHIEEYDAIMLCQKQFYSDVLTDKLIAQIRNEVIFYQRKLKSCKHLVSFCDMEKQEYQTKDGRVVVAGPKTAPNSSPLAQVCKIWESINNIVLRNKQGDVKEITKEQKDEIYQFMETHEKLKVTDLYKILKIKKNEGWWGGKAIGTGLQGDKTRLRISKALNGKYDHLLQFDLSGTEKFVNKETGEELDCISKNVTEEPLFELWHTLYSISDISELKSVLRKKFEITDEEVLNHLAAIDFVKDGYANKSHKYMRKLLPQLQNGEMYAHACEIVGKSDCKDYKAEKRAANGALLLSQISKGELRQPIVEKVLNQMINVVNALIEKYGEIDEIRVELARNLKQNREERNEDSKRVSAQNKANEAIAQRIQTEYKFYPTKSRIRKYRMWEETDHRCIYCGATVNIKEFLTGFDVEVEHIIPRSLLFNDSFSNKTCACKKCNDEKGQMTGIEFAESKGKVFYDDYINRINELVNSKKISRSKFKNLTTQKADIPSDFIERQLRETQYISRKAVEILKALYAEKSSDKVHVKTTGGIVTDFLRHQWGWDTVLHQSNFARFAEADLVEEVQVTNHGETHMEKRIKGWSKRIDHRHHAIDALTVACTKQSYIQKLNTLNANKEEAYVQLSEDTSEGNRSFVKRVSKEAPFTTAEVLEAVDNIIVSFKPIKKTITTGTRKVYKGGKRKVAQTGVVVPRGPLTEETIYGRINRYGTDGELVDCTVGRYKLSDITSQKDADYIVDEGVKRLVKKRLEAYNNNAKEAFAKPLYSDEAQTKEIKSVRCFTGLAKSSLTTVKRDSNGNPIGYAKTGSNHHVAFYYDENGDMVEHIATFNHAVDRRRFGFPAIIENPAEVWDKIEQGGKLYDDEFLAQLPNPKWTFISSLQKNEMVVLGMADGDFEFALEHGDFKVIAQHLYKVQKLSSLYYCFTRHTETTYDQKLTNKPGERFVRFSSLNSLVSSNIIKVVVNVIGDIVEK
ncbi:MAG: type II CRISPR RNA-guided endonuclease Cas9 [Muribaculaceae bacterium]|nr:type II CRISPR RNA-guided endonuclease Cas9 [Muribaculaceae bacterium]